MINKPNHRSLSLILGFSITVAIWLREVVSCRDFILRSVATFWVMSLVGIYPGRASNKVMTNYPHITLPEPNSLVLSRAPLNFLYIYDNRRSLNVFPRYQTFCCMCKNRLALTAFPAKCVWCYVSCLTTAEAASQTVYNMADVLKYALFGKILALSLATICKGNIGTFTSSLHLPLPPRQSDFHPHLRIQSVFFSYLLMCLMTILLSPLLKAFKKAQNGSI